MAAAILSSLLSTINNLKTPSETTTELKQTVLRIQPYLHDAEQRENAEATVEQWLHQLKHVSYDAEDALDDYLLQLQEVPNSTHLQFQASATIKSITESLNNLAHQCKILNFMERGTPDDEVNSIPNISYVEEVGVYGREDDKKRVLELLLSNPRSNLSVLPVVGISGVGKTTIADLVYNDPFVCQHFDVRGWVCVSKDFDLMRLMGAIVASVSEYPSYFPELSSLQSEIQQYLRGKRFLLVLDDVCNEDQSLWETLRNCLTAGLNGSVVLVTTREDSVARIMQTVPSYRLECLSEQDCWLLFRQCAFGSQEMPSNKSSLVIVGMGIAKKLRGLPLAAKMVSSLLASQTNEQFWYTILHSDLWGFGDEIVDIISPVLALSYSCLPTELKRCFAYFALFPKNYLFRRDSLVRLWMAEGFILPKQGKRIEDVGVEYFVEFLRRSFLQYYQVDSDTFVMHDLIHDLSISISGEETCKIQNGDLCSINSKVRVLSLAPQDFGEEIQIQSTTKPRPVRTFVLMNKLINACAISYIPNKKRLNLHIPDSMFINLKCLRTLDLSETVIEELPDSIGNLKHLRFLGLNHTRIRSLPESICSLFYLQTLEMRDCNKLEALPRDMKNLVNMRHLTLPRYSSMVPLQPGIDLLTNLQTLSPFCVGNGEQHSTIADLKCLVHLRGELEIGRLECVTNIDNASGALKDKECLTSLILHSGHRYIVEEPNNYDYSIFGGEVEDFLLSPLFGENSSLFDDEVPACNADKMDNGFKQNALKDETCKSGVLDDGVEQEATKKKISKSTLMHDMVRHRATRKKTVPNKVVEDMEVDIFECLRPHTNLRELVIWSYHSMTFPKWLGDPSFSELVSIRLESFYTRSVLPPLGQLLNLKHLVIQNFSELESIGYEFYGKCSTVTDQSFPSLETLQFGGMYKWAEWYELENVEFPRLHQLKLDYCPKLRRIPHCLPSLKKLVVRSCDELRVLPILPSLTSLELDGYRKDDICSTLPQQLLTGLHSLKISGCKNLSLLPLHNIYALTELEILSCLGGESYGSSFVHQVSKLTCLKHLKMHYCPDIRFSENLQLPSTLELLDIFHCPFLAEWCLGEGASKLIHIARVILDKKDIFFSSDNDNLH